MARVRAKKDVYLGDQGYRSEGEEFDYTGKENTNLEYLERSADEVRDDNDTKYHNLSREELKAECIKRNIAFASNAQDAKLRILLEADDK